MLYASIMLAYCNNTDALRLTTCSRSHKHLYTEDMGWFGDDSDEEEEKPKLALETFQTDALGPRISATPKAPKPTTTSDEDEDPLDSYMSSLSSTTATPSASKMSRRLDVENEEEATAHWKKVKCGSTVDKNVCPSTDKAQSDGPSRYNYESVTAKASMASTFLKAGESSKRNADEVEDHKRTIDPLENINHTSISYAPFRKSFYNAKPTNFGSTWRRENGVICSIELIDPITSFEDYGSTSNGHGIFAPEIMTYLHDNGFHKATHVQSQSIPLALAGRDLIVTSHTGSGKTLAFLLPLVTHVIDQPHIVPNQDGPISLILTPTRELAKQVHLVAKKLLQVVGGKACAVTGGMGTYEMSKELKRGAELIVSTPGRFIDMVKRKSTNCKRITFVVLDEADKMLDMGFETQCGSILGQIRPDRQTLMFSATFGKRVERAAKGWLNNPIRIAIGRTGSSSEHVDQHVLVLPSYHAKVAWLAEMLPILANVGKMIIFVESRVECEALTEKISGKGIAVDSIHGDKHQSSRNAALSALRKGKIKALVATDVAARGLDVTDIMTVINFAPAKNLDSHVHR